MINNCKKNTNISKIIYYGFVQNLIFNGLQQALFALTDPFFDDDEEEYEKELAKKEVKIINGMIDSIVRWLLKKCNDCTINI